MFKSIFAVILLIMLTGCDNWGDYQYSSEKFKFKITFPDKWEVWDKSDDARDFLQGSIPSKPESKIELIAIRTAPDLHVNELYPTFESGGDDAFEKNEFAVDEKGTFSASNGEGRFIKAHWEDDKGVIRCMNFLFVGNRYQMNINCVMREEDYMTNEADFVKMVRRLQL